MLSKPTHGHQNKTLVFYQIVPFFAGSPAFGLQTTRVTTPSARLRILAAYETGYTIACEQIAIRDYRGKTTHSVVALAKNLVLVDLEDHVSYFYAGL